MRFVLLCIFFRCAVNAFHINQFAVRVTDAGSATVLSLKYGFRNHGQIGSLTNFYLFSHDNIQKRSVEANVYYSSLLKNDSMVLWFEQQKVLKRVKRDIDLDFRDPLYPEQWFIQNGGNGECDMNAYHAWFMGYTGRGVVVTILDDGVQSNHPDLAQNYDPYASYDINGADDDPSPKDDDYNKHGTRCAGEVAAVAGNQFCGVGIAFNASIGGVRMLDGAITDSIEAQGLSLRPNHIDIYSASWGPEDNGKTVDGPGVLAKAAFENGVKMGRNGLGSIFVWASGNGRILDNCNCDGYANSIYTISVSSATQSGMMPWYLEECSSTIATTYSSGSSSKDKNIVTTDVNYSYLKDSKAGKKTDSSTLCTRNHTGTSASAPIAAAICALVLEANPRLTWRDMQYLIVLTSRPAPLSKEDGWLFNKVGRQVSTKFGYGLMDAAEMVKLASVWKTVPKQHICSTAAVVIDRIIPPKEGAKLELNLTTDGCKATKNFVQYLEHVEVRITLAFHPRGNLRIILISPSGTPSSVLLPRPLDTMEDTFNDWPFMSVHFWGENPQGIWRLQIINEGNLPADTPGKLFNWSVTLYGTGRKPSYLKSQEHQIREMNDHLTMENCKLQDKYLFANEKSQYCYDICPDGYYGNLEDSVCHQCDKSCKKCYGPSYKHCLACLADFALLNSTCKEFCPLGYFKNEASLNSFVCVPCSYPCYTCSSMYVCSSCQSNYFLYGDQCLPVCPSGFYASANSCFPCHELCTECYGPTENDCFKCKPNYFLDYSTCSSECRRGYSPQGDRCIRCHRSCKSCTDQISCQDCNADMYLYNSQSELCSPNECLGCPVCTLDYCKTCMILPDYCDVCKSGFWSSGKCYSSCPNYTFEINDECHLCAPPCDACFANQWTCSRCKEEFSLYKYQCLYTCPIGYYSHNGICTKCHSTCESCTGSSEYDCLSCHKGSYLYKNSCFDTCDANLPVYSDEKMRACLPCHISCKRCLRYGSEFCTSCHSKTYYSDGFCIPCLNGQYYDDIADNCHLCNKECRTCFGRSKFQCLSCFPPLVLSRMTNTCMPCCLPSDVNVDCCNCSSSECMDLSKSESPTKPHYKTDFISSNLYIIAVVICSSAVLIFVMLFFILQLKSPGQCTWESQQNYMPIPLDGTSRDEVELQSLSLSQEELEEDDMRNI